MSVSEAGRKGGKARAAKLTKARRIEIARQGYHASPLSTKRANNLVEAQNPKREFQ